MLFKIRVFFQLCWLSQQVLLCVLSHILLLLVLQPLSHSHFLHCGSTRYMLELQLSGTLVFPGKRLKLHMCSETSTVVHNLVGSSLGAGFDRLHNLQLQESLAWRKTPPPAPAKEAGRSSQGFLQLTPPLCTIGNGCN